MKGLVFFLHPAVNRSKILLIDSAAFYHFVHIAKRGGVLCGDDDTSGIPVNTVAESGRKGIFSLRIPLAPLIKVSFQVVKKSRTFRLVSFLLIALVAPVRQNARRFVQEDNIAVLINDVEARSKTRKLGGIRSGLFGKKLVGDKHFDRVSCVQYLFFLGTLPVDFYPFFPDKLIHKGKGQPPNRF